MMTGKWDLTPLYQSFDDPAFAADIAALPGMIAELNETIAQELPAVEKLEKLTSQQMAIGEKLEQLFLLCELTLAADATNATAALHTDKLYVLSNDISLADSAVTRYIGSLDNLEECIAASEKLQEIAFALRESREQAKHVIPAEIEPWVLQMRLSGGTAFSQLRDKLDSTHTVEYRGESLPLPAVRGMAYDPDASVRKDAYEAEIASYKKIEMPMSYCLNSIKLEARTLAKARGYASVLDMTLEQNRMDRQTLDAMWTAIREYLPHFRRYMRAKAKYLGHEDGLPFYDLFAPVGDAARTYTIEKARQKLIDEMGKFTPDMAAFIDNAFEQNWIDVYPREGKTGGAFCAGWHKADRSFVLTNYQGSFSGMLTDTPMPLAETASIFNETMLSHQVLKNATEQEQFTLIEAELMEATQTVVDIYSRFLFESEVVDTRADHAMTVDELKDCMLRAQDASYGDGLDKSLRHPYMWACKSHYYSSGLSFYNFPYAFGLLFGKGVFAQYLKEGDSFVAKYNQLLRSCGSGSIADVAASVGIDVRSADFWRSSLEVVKESIDRFCALCEK